MKNNTGSFISIVVAVFNMQDTLDRCVQSLIKQTFKGIEIILVNDGSTDHTGSLCDDYAKKDDRIKVIHQKNMGLPLARKAGLKEAKGQYISFVDADDWCEEDMCERLYKKTAGKNVDIMFFSAFRHRNDGIVTICNLPIENGHYSVEEIHECYILPLYGDLKTDRLVTTGYVWCCLFRTEILRDIKFYKDICMHEDEIIVLQALSRAKNICVTDDVLYHYNRMTPNSLSKRTVYWENYWENIIDVYNAKKEFAVNFFTDETQYMGRLVTYLYLKMFRSIRNETHYSNPRGFWGGLLGAYRLKDTHILFQNNGYLVKAELSPTERCLAKLVQFKLCFVVYIYYAIKCRRMRTYVEKTKN